MPLDPPVIQLAYAEEQLQLWSEALARCASGASYSIGGQTLTRQDVATVIRPEIQRWHNTIATIKLRYQGKVRAMGSQVAFGAPGSGSGGIIPDGLWRDYRT